MAFRSKGNAIKIDFLDGLLGSILIQSEVDDTEDLLNYLYMILEDFGYLQIDRSSEKCKIRKGSEGYT